MCVVDILPLMLLFTILYKCKAPHLLSDELNADYLSIDSTNVLRGVFALAVVFHHISQKSPQGLIMPIFREIGYLAVSFFFFLSGYGLMKQYIAKKNYHKLFLLKRIPSILIPYTVANIVYWIFFKIQGTHYTIMDFLSRIASGNPIAHNSWYILSILWCYLCFWGSMYLLKNRPILILLFNTMLCCVYTTVCLKLGFGSWWYNSIFIFPIGMLWAIGGHHFVNMFSKLFYPCCLSIFALLFLFIRYQDVLTYYFPFPHISIVLSNFTAAIFILAVLFIILKFQISNGILRYLGTHSLEIYMYHGLFTIGAKPLLSSQNGYPIYAITVFICSLVLAHCMHQINQWLLKTYKKVLHLR